MSGSQPARILIVGGGYVGMYTALRLQRSSGAARHTITVVDPQSYMTYQPFLPEAAAGNLEPRHIVVPLRKVLQASARSSTAGSRRSTTRTDGARRAVRGRRPRARLRPARRRTGLDRPHAADPGPGRAGHRLQDRRGGDLPAQPRLARLDLAESIDDEELRRRALTFVFVGGGYAGVEAIAELEDMARYAMRYYPDVDAEDLRWVLVEAAGRIMPEVACDWRSTRSSELRERGIEVRLNTRLESWWTATSCSPTARVRRRHDRVDRGSAGQPDARATDLPLDEQGRLTCRADLRVTGVDDVWAAGDCAAVPDLSKDDPARALRADRPARGAPVEACWPTTSSPSLRGERAPRLPARYAGSVASLGLHRGVAEVYGIKLQGLAGLVHAPDLPRRRGCRPSTARCG